MMRVQPQGWRPVNDGSLKDAGMEFTLAVWHNNAEEYLNYLFQSLDKPRASSRCSVHVHTNVTDFTETEIKSLILLYTIFERPLFRYSGNRWNNIYCVPVQTWAVGHDLSNMTFNDIAITFPKYSAMNVFPDDGREGGRLGTVEFRHMVGNRNIMYITTWIDMLAMLVQYAKKQDYKHLLEQIHSMRTTSQYWELFRDIFKHLAPVLNYSSFDKDVEQGITFAKLMTA